jgi:hypothetical protein
MRPAKAAPGVPFVFSPLCWHPNVCVGNHRGSVTRWSHVNLRSGLHMLMFGRGPGRCQRLLSSRLNNFALLAVGCACAAGRQGLSNRVFESGLSCGGGLPRSGTLRVRTSSSRRAGSTGANTIGLRARRPVRRSESRRYRHIRDRRDFWRPGAPQRVSSRHAQVIAKRRTHRPQNAGVALNRRHLLRSVFSTAIWSRACQPATAPMAR